MYTLKCPNCGSTTVEYRHSARTAMGWAHIIQDGVEISQDPNYETSYYTCHKCHHNFHIRSQYGTITEIIDDGKIAEVPIIDTDELTVSNAIPTNKKLTIDTKPPTVSIPINIDIEKLKAEIEELRSEVHELQKTVWELEHPGEWYDY